MKKNLLLLLVCSVVCSTVPFGEPEFGSSPFGQPPVGGPPGGAPNMPFGPGMEQDHPDFGTPPSFGSEDHPAFGENRPVFGQEGRPAFGQERHPDFGRERRPDFGQERRPDFGRDSRNQFDRPGRDEFDRDSKPSKDDSIIANEVDTFDKEATGNWLLKRVWWEKIEEVYELIKKTFNDIMSVRMSFVSKRNSLDRELDIFYGQMGLEEGPLSEIIDHGLELLKQEKNTQQGFLNKEQERFLGLIQGKERDLEQLKLNIKALQELGKKLDDALDVLFQQIDIANRYEQKAWETFKEVARELDDKAARKSYYETEGLLKDIKNVHSYLIGEFSSYFSQAIQSAQSHSEMITSQMQALKNSGIDLKKIAEELEQAQKAELAEKKASEAKIEALEKAKLEKAEDAKKPHGFIQKTIASVKDTALHLADRVITFCLSVVKQVQGWFSKEQKTVEKNLSKETKKFDAAEDKEFKSIDSALTDEQKLIKHQEAQLPVEKNPIKDKPDHTLSGHGSFGEPHHDGLPGEDHAFGHEGASADVGLFGDHDEDHAFGQRGHFGDEPAYDRNQERHFGALPEEEHRPFGAREEGGNQPFGNAVEREEREHRPVSVMPAEHRFGPQEEEFRPAGEQSVSPFHRP